MALIIIFGLRSVQWVDEEGERQDCPCCRAHRSIYPAKRFLCFHLYFIPVVPLHTTKFFKCRSCRALYVSKPNDERHRHLEPLRMVPTTAAFSGNSWYTLNKKAAAAKRREAAAAEAAAGQGGAAQPQPQRWLYLASPPRCMPQRPKVP